MSCFFFNDTATTEIYTLSLHDALPIYEPQAWGPAAKSQVRSRQRAARRRVACGGRVGVLPAPDRRRAAGSFDELSVPSPDRKSTRLNSSHANISYAVFCL